MAANAYILTSLQRLSLAAILGGQAVCVVLMTGTILLKGQSWLLVAGFAASLAGSAAGIALGLRWRAIRRQARSAGWALCDRCLYPVPSAPPPGTTPGPGAASWARACPECGNDLSGVARRWARSQRD
jgi:hypothetical protein